MGWLSFLVVKVDGIEPHRHVGVPTLGVDPQCPCINWLVEVDSHFGVNIVVCLKNLAIFDVHPYLSIESVGQLYGLDPLSTVRKITSALHDDPDPFFGELATNLDPFSDIALLGYPSMVGDVMIVELIVIAMTIPDAGHSNHTS